MAARKQKRREEMETRIRSSRSIPSYPVGASSQVPTPYSTASSWAHTSKNEPIYIKEWTQSPFIHVRILTSRCKPSRGTKLILPFGKEFNASGVDLYCIKMRGVKISYFPLFPSAWRCFAHIIENGICTFYISKCYLSSSSPWKLFYINSIQLCQRFRK